MYDFSLYEQEAYTYALSFYSSFLLSQYRYIYVGSYKTGSTTMIILLTKLAKKISELQSGSTRSTIPLPDIALSDLPDYFNREYTIFSICRNPILKLFSGWSDKILAGNTTNPYIRQLYNLPLTIDYSIESIRRLFESFVEDIYFHRDAQICNDKHWIPQHVGLLIDRIDYTEIVRFEEINTFIRKLLTKTDNLQYLEEDGLHLNRADIPYCSDYITSNSLSMILEVYEKDFAIFGYPQVLPIKEYVAPNYQLLGLSREERNRWYAERKET